MTFAGILGLRRLHVLFRRRAPSGGSIQGSFSQGQSNTTSYQFQHQRLAANPLRTPQAAGRSGRPPAAAARPPIPAAAASPTQAAASTYGERRRRRSGTMSQSGGGQRIVQLHQRLRDRRQRQLAVQRRRAGRRQQRGLGQRLDLLVLLRHGPLYDQPAGFAASQGPRLRAQRQRPTERQQQHLL